MFTKFYTMLAVLVVAWYTTSTALGWEYFNEPKEKTDEKDRQSGYRSHGMFIYVGGFRGGK